MADSAKVACSVEVAAGDDEMVRGDAVGAILVVGVSGQGISSQQGGM